MLLPWSRFVIIKLKATYLIVTVDISHIHRVAFRYILILLIAYRLYVAFLPLYGG